MPLIKRYGIEGGKGTGGQHLPFARAAEADGWLYVSGQVPMLDGEVVSGKSPRNLARRSRTFLPSLKEAGYSTEHIVRCGSG